MEEVVTQRLIGAAEKQGDDPGWTIRVLIEGIRITYTWQTENRNFYTVESMTPWASVARARMNPLITSMDDLIKQKTEFKA